MTYLRFGIRDLLWAMVVVGMGTGWFSDRLSLTAGAQMHQATLKDELQRKGERIAFLENQRDLLEKKLRECHELHPDN